MEGAVIPRETLLGEIVRRFEHARVVALLGPRQSGKTTLAREYCRGQKAPFEERLNFFDLENPVDLDRLENPMLALQDLQGLVVVDEVQRRPELFPVLRVLADRADSATRFLLLGSASRDLIRQGAETLAGRISFLEVPPLDLGEVGLQAGEKLWLRGGYPLSFLAGSDAGSLRWRMDYVRTFLERDIPALGFQIPAATLRRFWMMMAHSHGQVFNASDLGRSLGIAHTTAMRYLDILTGTFMMRRISPWFENIGKRQVKSPKVYFRDSGLLHALLGLETKSQLLTNPKLGASWEGFAMEQIIRWAGVDEEEVFFWGVHSQGELDLILSKGGQRFGFEVKYADTPKVTSFQKAARDALGLVSITIINPGKANYVLSPGIQVTGLSQLLCTEFPPNPA
jgi:uncharacterized protein